MEPKREAPGEQDGPGGPLGPVSARSTTPTDTHLSKTSLRRLQMSPLA